jgi:hypothetical protein
MSGPRGYRGHPDGIATARKVWGEPFWKLAQERFKLKVLASDTTVDHSRGRDWSTVASGRS